MSHDRKLRLDVQDLQVESFDSTERAAARRGTVRANEFTPFDTCAASCNGTCYHTCAGGVCPPLGETEDPTCAYTCYWINSRPFYDGIC